MKLPTRQKSIRLKCIDCCCGDKTEVRLCPAFNCALWPFRMGISPTSIRQKEVNEEALKAALDSGDPRATEYLEGWKSAASLGRMGVRMGVSQSTDPQKGARYE